MPEIQVIVLLRGAAVPVIITVAVVEIGARVEVPTWVAVIVQFPLINIFKVDPVIEQIPVEVVAYVIAPPLDAAAVKAKLFAEKFTVAGGVKEIVCASRVTSKLTL